MLERDIEKAPNLGKICLKAGHNLERASNMYMARHASLSLSCLLIRELRCPSHVGALKMLLLGWIFPVAKNFNWGSFEFFLSSIAVMSPRLE